MQKIQYHHINFLHNVLTLKHYVIQSFVFLSICSICILEVDVKTCILDFFATSISFLTALVKPQTVAFLTILEISTTELKSPGLETGKPASITSTPSSSSLFAIISF